MKTFKLLTITTSLLLLCSVVSCSDDDIELYEKEELYGIWQRYNSDSTCDGAELYLNYSKGKYWGGIAHTSGSRDGEYFMSSMSSENCFSWTEMFNVLTLHYPDEIVRVKYSLDENGHLFFSQPNKLTNYKDCYFVKFIDY